MPKASANTNPSPAYLEQHVDVVVVLEEAHEGNHMFVIQTAMDGDLLGHLRMKYKIM